MTMKTMSMPLSEKEESTHILGGGEYRDCTRKDSQRDVTS
jgi:hypothetical protein